MINPDRFPLFPSPVDDRDFKYQAKRIKVSQSVDLRDWDGLVEDQGNIGSCTGNALTNAYEIQVKILYPMYAYDLSRLFVYYNSRLFYRDSYLDDGAYLRDTLKSAHRYGICTEKLWPYAIDKFNVQPTPECYADGAKRTVTQYEAIYNIDEMIEVLSGHRPLVTGIEVYESFMTLTQGDAVVALPDQYDVSAGKHALAIIGYNLEKKLFLAKNSFGTAWGDMGYCWIPFEYITKQMYECWCFDISDQSGAQLG